MIALCWLNRHEVSGLGSNPKQVISKKTKYEEKYFFSNSISADFWHKFLRVNKNCHVKFLENLLFEVDALGHIGTQILKYRPYFLIIFFVLNPHWFTATNPRIVGLPTTGFLNFIFVFTCLSNKSDHHGERIATYCVVILE